MSLPINQIVNVQVGTSSGGPGISEDIPVAGVGLNKYDHEMRVGESDRLYPVFNPGNAVDRVVYWTEDTDGKVITVSDGVVLAVAVGRGYVTCTTEDGSYRARCLYNIIRALIPVTSIELSSYEATVEEGKSTSITATLLPEDAEDKTYGFMSSDSDVATISSDGYIVGVAAGTCNVTAVSSNGVVSKACVVTVTAPTVKVTDISLSESSVSNVVGETRVLTATIQPTNATNKAVLWRTGNESYATVDQTGTVTAVAPGQTDITATTVDGGYSAVCRINVIAAIIRVTGVSINGESAIDMDVGNTVQLTAAVTPADATLKDVLWRTSDGNVLTVSETGLVSCVGAGSATITVTTNDGGFTDSVSVRATNPNISVTGVAWAADSPAVVNAGHQAQTSIVITPADATNQKVSYNSSNPEAVTVDTNGVIYGQAAGTSTITATTDDGGFAASFTATCSAVATITPDGLGGIPVGGVYRFTYSLSPSDAKLDNIRFESADPTIATVDSTGLVTGVAEGGCNIWMYADQNGTEVSVATWAQIAAKVQVYPQYVEWLVGNSQQMSTAIYPSDSKDVTITYTSADPAIISVDDKGMMTALAQGSTSINVNVKMNGVSETGSTSPYVSTLSVSTDSLPTIKVGVTQQLVVSVSPSYAKEDSRYNVTYTTSDATVATVSDTGLITALTDGGCRIGAVVTVGNATDTDSSYQTVDEA